MLASVLSSQEAVTFLFSTLHLLFLLHASISLSSGSAWTSWVCLIEPFQTRFTEVGNRPSEWMEFSNTGCGDKMAQRKAACTSLLHSCPNSIAYHHSFNPVLTLDQPSSLDSIPGLSWERQAISTRLGLQRHPVQWTELVSLLPGVANILCGLNSPHHVTILSNTHMCRHTEANMHC